METNLLLVVGISFVVPILITRMRLHVIPVVVAEILAGMVIGGSGFNLIHPDSWLEHLSTLGLIFLMFLSGLEIDFSVFTGRKKPGPVNRTVNPFWLAVAILAGIFIVSFVLAAYIVSWGMVKDRFWLTLMLATISLGVVMPVLKERKLSETGVGQALLMTATLADFFTVVLLSVYVSWLRSGGVFGQLTILILFVAAVVLYYVLRRVLEGEGYRKLHWGTVHIGTRAVFVILLLLVVLAQSFGVEYILGAFLAGTVVSLVSPQKEFIRQLDSIGYGFLIPIFFVMVGVRLNLQSLLKDPSSLLLTLTLLAGFFITKLIPALIMRQWYSWKKTLGAGALLSSTLSLIVAGTAVALKMNIIDESGRNAFILAAVISVIIAPVIFNHIYPFPAPRKKVVAFLGANHITLPVASRLMPEYEVILMDTRRENPDQDTEVNTVRKAVVTVPSWALAEQDWRRIAGADVVIIATDNDRQNRELAEQAKRLGAENVIVQVEEQLNENLADLEQPGLRVFSGSYAAWTLLQSMIVYPGLMKKIAGPEDTVTEVVIQNAEYDGALLRDIPCMGDSLVLRILRDDLIITPHGNTVVRLGDRLFVSGSIQCRVIMKEAME
ncbi:cation/h+ exchanger [Lucifera butyrica]|uniref:Cation/h+ exchanger n=1 Tax=Lucifera butyrica TaxID=1351585 RepID=A0A498R317_9FIRM|nr:cation:proton antiporter [Lucifera butyrica]VBB05170.1 cation/h+ exchanger [Lucifera butyrica]